MSRRVLRVFLSVFCLLALTALPFFSFARAEDNPANLPPLPKGPLLLTSVTPDMLNADYWIKRIPRAGELIKSPSEIEEFNEFIHAMVPGRVDVFKIGREKDGRPIADLLREEFGTLRGRVFWGADGRRISKEYFDRELKPRIQAEKVPARIPVRWAAVMRSTSVRALPTGTKMLEAPDDVEFDQLQYTLLKVWTPVAVYHTSAGGSWYYIQAPYTRGWVKSRDLAVFESREALEKQALAKSFLVVTGDHVAIYEDADLRKPLTSAAMGARIPLEGRSGGVYRVKMPAHNAAGQALIREAFVSTSADMSEGYLPYTQAQVLRQAFKLLGARYGWGGTYNGRDCSGFTFDVFLTFGIDMPRNSREQIFAGTQLGYYEDRQDQALKIEALQAAMPGITLLTKPLHMMLYVGQANGHFYILHSTWAERVSMTSDEKNRINQVVLSDMTLNGHSYLSSLFDRVDAITEIR